MNKKHTAALAEADKEVKMIIEKEAQRQRETINLIPSENYTSVAVREALASELVHKYSEGNIGKRYYEGNEFIDQLEKLTIARATELFSLPVDWSVNVQALSGSNANLATYLALLEPGDTILSMYLPDGGHLSHGWSFSPKVKSDTGQRVYLGGDKKVHIVSKLYNVVQYKTNPETELFDYDEIQKLALKYKPKIIISGGTAYPRLINHKRMAEIVKSVDAYYMADIAHEAGLVATGVIPSPIGYADVVTMTTHKTLRAARGALILAKKEIIDRVNRAILPGLQGGPFNNNIAGICVGLGEALNPEYKTYTEQILKNRQVLEEELVKLGFRLVANGGDKHLLLIDLTTEPFKGKIVSKALAKAGIILNMNTIPGEKGSPADPSGIRLGTPFVTTQGLVEKDMVFVASKINKVIKYLREMRDIDSRAVLEKIMADQILIEIADEVKEYMASN